MGVQASLAFFSACGIIRIQAPLTGLSDRWIMRIQTSLCHLIVCRLLWIQTALAVCNSIMLFFQFVSSHSLSVQCMYNHINNRVPVNAKKSRPHFSFSSYLFSHIMLKRLYIIHANKYSELPKKKVTILRLF